MTSIQLICDVFKDCLAYRIGGDEIVVILQGDNYEGQNKTLLKMNDEINKYNQSIKGDILISVAMGIAEYDKKKDACFSDVFMRADNEMYKNKVELKRNIK